MGAIRSTAVQFIWHNTDVNSLLASIEQALGCDVGDWNDDGGELVGIAGFATSDGLNLASYWKAGFFSPLEPIGLSIDQYQTEEGADVLGVVAIVPPGNAMGNGKKGLIQIASMPGATWVPFEKMGMGRLQVDFVNPS